MLASRNCFPHIPLAHLRRLRPAALLASIAAAALLAPGSTSAFAQDRMWSLVPPDAPALSGMRRTSDKTDQVWLATRNNVQDLNAFISLTDTDRPRRIDRVIVSAAPVNGDLLGEHLLIAEGRFRHPVDTSQPSHSTTFAGVSVQLIDGDTASDTRWFAVLDDRMVLFGSPAAVKKALLRHSQHAPVDPLIEARLRRVPSDDATWSSVTLDPALLRSKLQLHGYEQTIVPCLTATAELDLGVRLDKQAKVDLRVVSASHAAASEAVACLRSLASLQHPMALSVGWSTSDSVFTLSMRAPRDRYAQWLDTFREPFASRLLASAALPERTAHGD